MSAPVVVQDRHELLIAGSWVPAGSGRRIDVENPATGECVATVPDAGPEEAMAALDAAVAAQSG